MESCPEAASATSRSPFPGSLRRLAKAIQAVEHCRGLRAWHRVPGHDDVVGLRGAGIGENGLQGHRVAVDVSKYDNEPTTR